MTLRNGERVCLRPIRPDDRDRLVRGMEELSVESRYLRFFSPVAKLSEKQLKVFTEVDQVTHVAWIAIDPDNLDYPGYGVARYVVRDEHPDQAEIAVTVLDRHQNKGVGTLLLALMYILGLRQGLRYLLGALVPENIRLVEWVSQLGAKSRYDDGVFRIEIPLYPDYAEKFGQGNQWFVDLLDQVAGHLFDKAQSK